MATLSTDQILQDYCAALAAGDVPAYRSGRLIETDGYVISAGRGLLAEYLPAGRYGRRRPLVLITGDEWRPAGPFQSSVQWTVRTALESAAHTFARGAGADTLVVPFSALAAAGIVRESIRPLELRPAHSWTETRYADEWRHVPVRERTVYRDEVRTYETFELVPSGRQHTWRAAVDGDTKRNWATGEDVPHEPGTFGHLPILPDEDGLYRITVQAPYDRARDEDGRYSWTVHRHRLGDALFTARVIERRPRRRPWTVRDVVRAAAASVTRERDERANAEWRAQRGHVRDGDLSPDEVRTAADRLGDVDLAAPIVETVPVTVRRRFVSSFDVNEPQPLYFLATLPGTSRARSVESALQDLAPAAVHGAIARGRDVQRQGDIFYVATDLADETIGAMAHRRARLTQLTRGARPRPGEVGYVAPASPSRAARMRAFRRRAFRDELARAVSVGYSSGAARPRTAPGTRKALAKARAETRAIDARNAATARRAVLRGDGRAAANARSHRDAYRARVRDESAGLRTVRHVAPDPWRTAGRSGGRDAYRHGYGGNAIAALQRARQLTLERFRPADSRATFERRRAALRDALSVHGTAHSATEVVRTRDGRTYVRGIARHVPEVTNERRGRDHVNLRLGDGRTWYLAIRNTVPRQRGTADARAAGWPEMRGW